MVKKMKKVMLVFGTRPEAIKMCPLVKELKTRKNIETVVCTTGQHREMLKQVLDIFDVVPDYELSIMKDKQTLFDVTTNILLKINEVLDEVKPDVVLVHGDTSTTFTTTLACFYKQIPVGHVEAGLRTYNIYSPYPEEFNRQAVGIIAEYNFAPTETAKSNLIKEGKNSEKIYVTGNTAIDALKTTVRDDYSNEILNEAEGKRMILITAHRRENLGEPMENMFKAIKRVIDEHDAAAKGGEEVNLPETSQRVLEIIECQLHAQNSKGLAEYGQTIDDAQGYDWTLEALSECVDAMQYMSRYMLELEAEIKRWKSLSEKN